MGVKTFLRAQLSPLCHFPVETFNSIRLSIRLSNISITNYETFYEQDINFILSKIKKNNSPGPMWSEHMCSINIIMIIII